MPSYPECEKMAAVQKESRVISEFLEWVSEQELDICELGTGECEGRWFPIRKTRERLLAEHLGVDLDKVEEERREILSQLQKDQT